MKRKGTYFDGTTYGAMGVEICFAEVLIGKVEIRERTTGCSNESCCGPNEYEVWAEEPHIVPLAELLGMLVRK